MPPFPKTLSEPRPMKDGKISVVAISFLSGNLWLAEGLEGQTRIGVGVGGVEQRPGLRWLPLFAFAPIE